MYCRRCGKKIPDDAKFCTHCGEKSKPKNNPVNEKNMYFALILSLFFGSLGIYYGGNRKKGIILFIIIILFTCLSKYNPIYYMIVVIICAYALYETYREVKKANGDSHPNLFEDLESFASFKNIAPIAIILLLMMLYYFIIRILFY